MELTLVSVFFVIFSVSSEGLEIRNKVNILKEDGSDPDVSQEVSGTELVVRAAAKPDRKCNVSTSEDYLPCSVSKTVGEYEIKIPLIIQNDGADDSVKKVKFFNGVKLTERKKDVTSAKPSVSIKNNVPIVKGSRSNVKPDFLVPVFHLPITKIPFHTTKLLDIGNLWNRKGMNYVEGLESPKYDVNEWILNTTPFLGLLPKHVNMPNFTENIRRGASPPIWDVLGSGNWKANDPLSWNEERKTYRFVNGPQWLRNTRVADTNEAKYPSHNGYPSYHMTSFGNRHRPKGIWISCPPFETNNRKIGREYIPGCPRKDESKPSEVDVIPPIHNIDDKTLFKELGKTQWNESEEPKHRHS